MAMSKSVVLLSGGLDSTTALYHSLRAHNTDTFAFSVDYHQRHKRELIRAAMICDKLDVPMYTCHLDLPMLTHAQSALVNPTMSVPLGHYEAPTMRDTVVPNRNSVMLNLAVMYAMSLGASKVYIGVHAGDHAVYPDCRPEFLDLVQDTVRVGNEGFNPPDIMAPFLYLTKAQIVQHGKDWGVPYELTYSCYQGGPVHCGRCGTCTERKEAFQLAGVTDPTQYEG